MKKNSAIMAALALGMATATAGVAPAPVDTAPAPMDPCAGPISYNNIELLYASSDYGGSSESSDGGILRVESSPMESFYLAGGIEYTDLDFGNLWIFNVGLGGHFPLTDWLDIAGDAGWLYVRAEYDGFNGTGTGAGGDNSDDSDSESGWYARPHLRAKWGCFTAKAGAIYRDLGDDDNNNGKSNNDSDEGDWAYFIQLYYQFHSNWDITAGYMDGDQDFEQWTAGVRYRF